MFTGIRPAPMLTTLDVAIRVSLCVMLAFNLLALAGGFDVPVTSLAGAPR